MLGKLFKTEFKASGRLYLPLFIGMIFFAIVERIMLEIDSTSENSIVFNIIMVVLTVIFVLIIISVCVSGQFISIYRFYKSVFTDEGYLTNTLPVKSSGVVISKLLVGVVYTIFSYIVLLISGLIMIAGDTFKNILLSLRVSFGIENTNISLMDFTLRSISNLKVTFILLVGLAIAALFFNILVFYSAFAIGNMANRKKVLLSIIIYIGIINVLSFISAWVAVFFDNVLWENNSMLEIDIMNITLSVILAAIVIVSLVGYFITNKIIKSKLNLE